MEIEGKIIGAAKSRNELRALLEQQHPEWKIKGGDSVYRGMHTDGQTPDGVTFSFEDHEPNTYLITVEGPKNIFALRRFAKELARAAGGTFRTYGAAKSDKQKILLSLVVVVGVSGFLWGRNQVLEHRYRTQGVEAVATVDDVQYVQLQRGHLNRAYITFTPQGATVPIHATVQHLLDDDLVAQLEPVEEVLYLPNNPEKVVFKKAVE